MSQFLPRDWRIIALDLPGHGETTRMAEAEHNVHFLVDRFGEVGVVSYAVLVLPVSCCSLSPVWGLVGVAFTLRDVLLAVKWLVFTLPIFQAKSKL